MQSLPGSHAWLYDLFRAEIDAARASDFALARRIPDTTVWRWLHVLDTSDTDARESFYDYAARSAMSRYAWIAGLPPLDPATDRHESLFRRRFTDLGSEAQFTGIPELRMMRGAPPTMIYKGATIVLPKALIDRADAVIGVKAPELRKAVKQALGALGLSRPSKEGGGGWTYPCTLGHTGLVVEIDYGSRLAQLRYDVTVPALGGDRRTNRIIYETMLGLGRGDWDIVTVDNLDESMRVLVDVVRRAVELSTRVRSLARDRG